MIIVSQERDGIFNFDNILSIRTIVDIENNKNTIISIDVMGAERYFIAKYATEERAKEVLEEMTEKYEDIELAKYDRRSFATRDNFIYRMPKE